VSAETILIAEDKPDHVLLIKRQLRHVGILNPVRDVANGNELAQYLDGEGVYANRREYPYPTLLLLDLKMPGRSGLEMLSWIKTHPVHFSLPTVVLTASNDTQELIRSYQLGARSFLTKPICGNDFENALRAILGKAFKSSEEGASPWPC
jgi:CheY-like chemotaxis protein